MMESYGIFPEGTRKGLIKTGEIKKGSILIGIKKKIPVIPIGLTYEEKGLRKKVIISIGKKMDVSKIYPGLKGEHNVTAIGYIETEDGSDIKYVYYLDPAPKVQDSVYGGLKIETPEKLLNSMLTCEEPNYAW